MSPCLHQPVQMSIQGEEAPTEQETEKPSHPWCPEARHKREHKMDRTGLGRAPRPGQALVMLGLDAGRDGAVAGRRLRGRGHSESKQSWRGGISVVKGYSLPGPVALGPNHFPRKIKGMSYLRLLTEHGGPDTREGHRAPFYQAGPASAV